MKFDVEISIEAKQDLREIYSYIAFDLKSPINAAGQLDRIESNILSLSELPDRFPLYPHKPWQEKELRYIAVDNYIVFYIADKKSKIVMILRVLYAGRDIQTIFDS